MAIRFSNPAAFQRILSRQSRLLVQKQQQQQPTLTPLSLNMAITKRTYSTEGGASEPAPPPLLAKMKGDLKTAMRAKDATRLAVLRSILAATLNASKTASPIRTDAQLVALLRKTAQASQDAIGEFKAAGRDDLVEKESAQVQVLLEYAAGSGVQTLSEQELGEIVEQVKAQVVAEGNAADMKQVMNKLKASGSPVEGKDYDKALLAKIVKEKTSTK